MRLPNICGVLTASALLIGATSANALTLTVDDLGVGVDDPLTVGVDESIEVTLTDSMIPGVINFAGTAGGFDLVISSGLGAPAIGGPNEAAIDLSVQTTVGNEGTLQVTLEDTGLSLTTGPNGLVGLASDLGINALQDASVVVESFVRIGASTVFEALSTLSSGVAVDLQETLRRTISSGELFDLQTVITVTHDNKFFSSASADANLKVAPIPLPAALPLFLTALVGLGFVGRQRRRQAA